jgi:hypothetical protein
VAVPPRPTESEEAADLQDVFLVLNCADTVRFEASIRTRVLPETLSGTLTFGCSCSGTWPCNAPLEEPGADQRKRLVAPVFA